MNSQKSGSTFSKQSIQRCCLGVQDNHFFQAYLSTYNYVLARRGSFCNRARLNFQTFPLRDMKWLSRRSKDELSL